MLLYYRTQVISNRMVHKDQKTESSSCAAATSQQTEDQNQLIRPKKLSNPILESRSHRRLHRELLLSYKCLVYTLPCLHLGPLSVYPCLSSPIVDMGFTGVSWLKRRVLEQRRLDQHRVESSQPPSDLEQELRKRRHKLLQYEQEELRQREDLQNVPEFVRVRDNLRNITISSY
ncbi:protein FAM107B [Triplophysa rosa]|uniref:protein FAM107B n=1 Tax=Triplophysa rosa TaxID=992332 RepID=UPI002545CED8|nr:protein FAM107B [Triplophysa rosa]